jgi:hypothetical protein
MELSWTTNQWTGPWTGPNDTTYSTVTGHVITQDWRMESPILDFKVLKGTTTGKATYNDIQEVLAQYQGDCA